jgi:hypothetical protein
MLAHPRDRRRAATAYIGGLAGVVVLVYAPFFAAAGPGDAWDALVAKSLREREWWTLPFPFSYDGGIGSPREAKDVLDFYVPLILVTGAILAAGIALGRTVRERIVQWRWLAWVVLAIGFVQYLLSRTDSFHETPLRVALAIALALCAGWAAELPSGRARIVTMGASVAILVLLATAGTANRLSALFSPPDVEPVDLQLADGVDAEPIEARALPEAVRAVQELVPPDEPIHVVTRRSDLVRIGNPLFPFLAQRPTLLDRDFELSTSPRAQAEVVAALRESRPRAVVRWNHPTTVRREDNRRGEPSGSRLLDEYLASDYRVRAEFGWYEILVPR